MTVRSEPYPPPRPWSVERLAVDATHTLYVEQVGRRDGVPVVFLHGGPGGGVHASYRQLFDPDHYRVVLFEQRGAGRSTPHASVQDNTTWDLVADIETLRRHLGIDRWFVFGGSWGATLALAYATTHPDRVLGVALRGVFLGRPSELAWLYGPDGAAQLWPDAWQDFAGPIPEAERHDLVAAYHRRVHGDLPEAERRAAAAAWCRWEATLSRLVPDPAAIAAFTADDTALAVARIETHYFVHGLFLQDRPPLLEAARDRLADVPVAIVQGRYDVVCPPRSAHDLARALPHAELKLVPAAGHSLSEPGLVAGLVAVMERWKHGSATGR